MDDRAGVSTSERVLEAARAGVVVDFGGRPSDRPGDEPYDVWGLDRQIPADFLLAVLTRANDENVHPRGVRIRGARVVGEIGWEWQRLSVPLELVDCVIDRRVVLVNAHVKGLTLIRCRIRGLEGEQMTCSSTLRLTGSTFSAPLSLTDAFVDGALQAAGVEIIGTPNEFHAGQLAVYASRLRISGSLYLGNGFAAGGAVVLNGARIGGNLHCTGGSSFRNPDGVALDLRDAEVAGSVMFRTGFTVEGRVDLSRMRITGHIDAEGGRIRNPGGEALIADRIELGTNLLLRQGFAAEGLVRLIGARVKGNWDCTGGRFSNPNGPDAIYANSVQVDGNIFLRGEFRAEGRVRMLNARAHSLDANGGSFSDVQARSQALLLSNLRVTGDVSFGVWHPDHPFSALGEVSLTGARIGGSLECTGGRFENHREWALDLANAEVDADASLGHGFEAHGSVGLAGARIGGGLNCNAGLFTGEFAASGMSLTGSFRWRELSRPPRRLILRRARVGELDDDESGWPAQDNLVIDGFSYDRLSDRSPRSPRARIAWIRRQPGYGPEPYQHLAALYRRSGQVAEATQVAMAQQDDLVSRGELTRPAQAWTWFLGRSIGHGYRPGRAAWALLMLYAVTLGSVWLGARSDAFIQVGNTAPQASVTASRCGDAYPCFTPAAYALENITPILNLHQSENWHPRSSSPSERLLRDWLYLSTVFGYAGTTLLAAALTGLARSA